MKNPVLRGFNPDPSACVYHDKVYVAVSTFQWVPGVTIYETNDLVNYRSVSAPLTHVDLRGNPIDTSIWAPQLSYVDGLFYLIYTEVKVTLRPFKDLHNYVITAPSIEGPWSKPVYLNSSGFDPSFYHEGKDSYLVQEIWDYRIKEDNKFAGIVIQHFDRETMTLTGSPKTIFMGTHAKKTEGPHVYKINGYYYLITAEGGTKVDHQVTVARSKNLFGPYELDPKNPMMTSKNNPDLPLQCAGHASLIHFKNQYYMYHLATRGYPSILGRETALQKVYLDDEGWIRLEDGNEPSFEIDLTEKEPRQPFIQRFNEPLSNEWLYLRRMPKKWLKRTSKGISVYGGDSLSSPFDVSVLGYRVDEFSFDTSVELFFEPNHFNELSGIGLYLDETKHVYFYISHDEKLGKVACIYTKNVTAYQVFEEKYPLGFGLTTLSLHVRDGLCSFEVNDHVMTTHVNIDFLVYNFTGTAIILATSDLNVRYNQHALLKSFRYSPIIG